MFVGMEPIPKAKVIPSVTTKGGEIRNETAGKDGVGAVYFY